MHESMGLLAQTDAEPPEVVDGDRPRRLQLAISRDQTFRIGLRVFGAPGRRIRRAPTTPASPSHHIVRVPGSGTAGANPLNPMLP